MVDYQPIVELVKQIPADTWKILQEIQKRRLAMMLHELLDKRERAPKQPPNAQVRKDRKWTGGVDDPQPDHHTGKTPSAARSSARLALSSLAALPEQGTIRLAACQISIFGITPVGCPVNLYRRLIV